MIARKPIYNENVFGKNVQLNKELPYYARHLLSPRSFLCPHCKALMWLDEKVAGSIGKPIFSMCCPKGKVKLPDPTPLSILIDQLLENPEFMKNIRIYNASFSFLSFKAESDINLSKNNVYTYRIRGMV